MPEPICLSRPLVDYMHAELVREHGGEYGIRDENMIESALARPQQKWHYGDADTFELAAAYGFGLVKNHGYVDGNKRVALMAIFVFLYQNGFLFDASNSEAVKMINDVAAGRCSEAALAVWIQDNSRPRD